MAIPNSSEVVPNHPVPRRVTDPDLIRAQLERILDSPHFHRSKRYPRFLRFIVEQSLAGHAELLKERLLGIEVFDRAPDYELATDPIVRIAAGEIRKRLAQYYVETGHEDELRIQLDAGNYMPEFHLPRMPVASGLATIPSTFAAAPSAEPRVNLAANRRVKYGFTAIVALLGLAAILGVNFERSTPVDQFWNPLLTSGAPPIICLGDLNQSMTKEARVETEGIRTGAQSNDRLALSDVIALNSISRVLFSHGKQISVHNSGTVTFADLHRQPVVLIGGRSNQWTMRSMQFLRFQVAEAAPNDVVSIRDSKDTSRPRWTVDFRLPYEQLSHEYGIVARYYDPGTGQPTIIAAGTGANGTIAAAEFLTTPAYLKEFTEHAPYGWKDRNIEILLKTEMIDGACGPPHIVTTYVW